MSISKEKLQGNLNKKYTFELVENLDSTMDYIKKYVDERKFNHIVIAKEDGGKDGGKSISTINMSLLIKDDISIEEVLKINTLTSTAVYSALKELYDIDLGLKWLNDLILDDKKVGEILCQYPQTAGNKLDYLIINVVLNTKKVEISGNLAEIRAIESVRNIQIDENLLLIKIVDYIDKYLRDDSTYLEIYKQASSIIGKEVDVYTNNESFSAVALLVNKYGYLLLDKSGEIVPLLSGKVSIKKK
ncbi:MULTISPECIES: biotin--[acetyl-CoA-carboxylase] ligase [unclassified Gemella]|uniref:biotin--[acetyl-CoA-carboxylase] ligase n=1 Tax=unclassified Gemella TaxID=2624949 RepID=UPI0010731D18|nr:MULTISPECIES: hypothetical protein [unclassified Gemella]MBF0709787.1 hypothetical protein [Gemella sp. GL1.1]MBF0747125.1 hypothetical protein [Gemella sp. 19428wG2_WT2a]NYS27131.1 hypothetical protein [Gemella sp. GL1]TFU58366.1 hypothetical protein E4T67_05615 [Gemella sp. WT2a]